MDERIVRMKEENLSKRDWAERVFLAVLFLAIGGLIMIVFSPWKPLLPKMDDFLGRVGLIVALLAAVFLIRKHDRYKKFGPVFYGLLVLAIAVSADWIFSKYQINYLGISDNTPAGWAFQKLNECMVIVSTVILLTIASRSSLGSIYIQKGNLKLGLAIGVITFTLAAIFSIPMATLFKAQNLNLARITPWIPWLLIFVLANATMEEILFRGLFLRKLEPFFGKFFSNLLIALVFTVIHGGAAYTSDQYIFLVILLPLALACGYTMQKTDAVWGSILFHAGMDIPIILGIFSNQF